MSSNAEDWAPASYDDVVGGGGAAGAVVANRLSADPSTRVLANTPLPPTA